MGATETGDESGTPRRLVPRFISRTSTSTFCWMASRSRCRRFRRRVVSVSAPPAPKFQASRGVHSWAALRISGNVTKRGGPDVWLMTQYYTPRRGPRAATVSPGSKTSRAGPMEPQGHAQRRQAEGAVDGEGGGHAPRLRERAHEERADGKDAAREDSVEAHHTAAESVGGGELQGRVA